DIHGEHDGDPFTARFAARGADARPGGGDDPGAETGTAEADGEARDPEALGRSRRRPDVAHARAGQAGEPLGAQPPPQRQQAERDEQQRPGEAHGASSRASRRAMAESAATSVPWADANATRSICPSRSRSGASSPCGLGLRSESGITLDTLKLVVPPAVESARPSGLRSHSGGSTSLWAPGFHATTA